MPAHAAALATTVAHRRCTTDAAATAAGHSFAAKPSPIAATATPDVRVWRGDSTATRAIVPNNTLRKSSLKYAVAAIGARNTVHSTVARNAVSGRDRRMTCKLASSHAAMTDANTSW